MPSDGPSSDPIYQEIQPLFQSAMHDLNSYDELEKAVEKNRSYVNANKPLFCDIACSAYVESIHDPEIPTEEKAAITKVYKLFKCSGCTVGARRSRLNVQRRRTQRNRRGRKHRKLRKLTTRRR